ncbi:MAG: exonuclease SbcCD subunit D [Nanoarchaeota archaeon]|nr:exonuclease SbcCD subunit D [Nanoarchaeota archaeon]MBU1644340.1 exonuclease SbcCD subunit D [Nanoarchaeota archaeon]MBU1976947.1 exonuclease SbcCD subunit D [Nanoarchaeota archaeon]
MKYAHLADLHLGSWRDLKMRDLSTKAFLTALNDCIIKEVDFILFAGDLFNTSLPSLDTLKIVTKKLKELKDKNLPVYVIAGSHDFSASGKTMLDVLENAGLIKNVCKGIVNLDTKELHLNFSIDEKTRTKITGILGRKGLLDRTYYQNLHRETLEAEEGYKIFMFHTTLNELKPNHLEMLESQPASFLPKGFNYYAGGHIHHPTKVELPGYGTLTYPGALFPNNFSEIEKYGKGGYYIITADEENQKIEWVPLEIVKHQHLYLNCSHKSSEVITFEIIEHFRGKDLENTLITIRLSGKIEQGRVSDIDFKNIFELLYSQGAYFVLKNTARLNSEEFEEIKIANSNPESIEEETIKEHLQQIKLFDRETELFLTRSLLTALNTTKKEGETTTNFENRIESEVSKFLNL